MKDEKTFDFKAMEDRIDTIISEHLRINGTFDVLKLDAYATKYIFWKLYGVYPKIIEYNCLPINTGAKIYEECDKLKSYGIYQDKSTCEQGMLIGCIYYGDGIIIGYHYHGIYALILPDTECDWVEDYLVQEQVDDRPNTYWVSVSQRGYNKTLLTIKNDPVDVDNYYNDDLNLEKIENFIQGDESGMIILYGKPGTGKTYLIRHIAWKMKDLKFLFIDSGMLDQIRSSDFVEFLYENRNSIVVFEDCETLLADRVSNYNTLLKTLLNLSDGILGDGLGLKFICTFNAEISKIDKAILRRGRLKYKYEFKDLTMEKTKKLCEKFGLSEPSKPMPLCDIFNNEDNGADTGKRFSGFDKV